jgi:NADPH:quinone reductase-like Zn-dependent oxidoreductase
MPKFTRKLGADASYVRPKTTLQDQLSADEISKKLEGYIKVDDISEVPIDTHLRYFTKKNPNDNYVFRLGGRLVNKTNASKYVILSNGTNSWPVQVKNTVFYKKMSNMEHVDQVHQSYKKKLEEKNEIIKNLMKILAKNNIKYNINQKPVKKSKDEYSESEDEHIHVVRKKIKLVKKDDSKKSKDNVIRVKRPSSNPTKPSTKKVPKKAPKKISTSKKLW